MLVNVDSLIRMESAAANQTMSIIVHRTMMLINVLPLFSEGFLPSVDQRIVVFARGMRFLVTQVNLV